MSPSPVSPNSRARDPRRATVLASLLVLGSCTSLQLGAALAASVFPQVGAAGMNFTRLTLSALILLAVARPKAWAWSLRQWLTVLAFGLTLAGMNGLFYAGIERVPLGPAVAIEFLGPLVLTALLSRRWREGLWIALALGGMGLFFLSGATGQGALDGLGVMLVLGAAACWGLYILVGERAGRTVPGTGGLAVAMLVAAVLTAPFGAVPAARAFAADPSLLWVAFPAGLLASVVPYSLEFAAMRKLPKPVFGILLALEPAVATLMGFLLLHQAPSGLQLGAVALVVAASAGATLTARR